MREIKSNFARYKYTHMFDEEVPDETHVERLQKDTQEIYDEPEFLAHVLCYHYLK